MPTRKHELTSCPWPTTPKTTGDLRELLAQDLADLQAGRITEQQASDRSKYASQLTRKLRQDIKAAGRRQG